MNDKATEPEEPQQVTAERKYDMTVLQKEPNAVFNLDTIGNTIVPICLANLKMLVKAAYQKRDPTDGEYAMLMQTALSQQANPYEKECGLMWNNRSQGYDVWVAAQVRIRKAQAQPDYKGYISGYITEDGVRHKPGRESTAKHDDIVGIWGEVHREGRLPFYYETWLKEVQRKSQKGTGKWDTSEILMLQKTNRDQTHKFGYADKMGNLQTRNELEAYNPPVLGAPECETLPRDQRPALQEPEQELPPASLEAVDAATRGVMYGGCVNTFRSKLEFEPADPIEAWIKFVTFVLMCQRDDIVNIDDWTLEMLQKVKAALDKDIPQPVLDDIARKPEATEEETPPEPAEIGTPTPEPEKTAEEKEAEDHLDAKLNVVEYKCGKCGKVSEDHKGTEEKPQCWFCLSDDITVIKHGEEVADG